MYKQLKTLATLVLAVSSWNVLAVNPQDPLWSIALEGNISSSVAVGATYLYVGTADGKVQAIVPATGAVQWSYTTGGSIGATPAVSADGATVYAASYDKNIYAINAASGTEKWRFTADAAIFSSPVLDEMGTVYVFSTNGTVHVIDPATGEESGEWPFGVSTDSSPAIFSKAGNTELFVGTENGYVLADNVDSGLLWLFNTDTGKAMSSPVLGSDNTVYVGSHDGYVYALNHADGSVKWKRQLNGRVASSLSIDKNTLYAASYDFGTLYALDMNTGAVWWEYQTGGAVFSTSAVGANGIIYIGTKTKLLAINESTGALAWSYPATNLDSPVAASPVITANGNVYAITQNGTLFALTGDGTTLAPSSWSMFRQNNNRNGMLLDTDGDGMPDNWEDAYGLNKNNASDATGNTDGDTLTNFQEYLSGTSPASADTDGDGIPDGTDLYPTHIGTPVSFLALADRIVTRASNPITILGSDLMANDSNPTAVNLSITATTNTVNTVNTKPTISSGNLSYTPATVNANDEFSYTLSDGTNARTGLVAANIVASTADVIGTANNEIVFAGGNSKNTDAGAGNDIIYDDADGDDTFLQGKNEGHDRLTINDSTARSDVIKFKSDVSTNEINLYKDGTDLVFNIRQGDSNICAVNALKNQTNNGVTAVQFANGVDTPWDFSKFKAIDDHIDVVATGGVINFVPDTVSLLTQNDFIPTNAQFRISVSNAVGGSVALVNSYVDQHIDFTLNTGTTMGSFQYTLTDVTNAASTTTATVTFNVLASDVSSFTFDGDSDDNVLQGSNGDDTFNNSPGFDIISGIGGEDVINFGIGGDKDTFFYVWDDGGVNHLGDTINLTSLNRADISLERQGLDIVAKIKSTGESIRLQDHQWQEASINAPIGVPYGLMPFKQINFSDGSLSDSGFTQTTSSVLVDTATENATKFCTIGGVANSVCIGSALGDKVEISGYNISGSSAADVVFGQAGDDRIIGNGGDDILYGGLGADIFNGGAGDDELYGDQGSDWLNGGSGNNYLNGGSMRDFYQIDPGSATNIIDNFDLSTGSSETTSDVLWFNSPIIRSNVKFFRQDDDLIVKVTVSGATSISTVLNYFSFSGYNVVDAKFPSVGGVTSTSPVQLNGSCTDQTLMDGLPSEAATGDSGLYCIPARVLYDMTHDDTCSNPLVDDDVLYGYGNNDTINANCGNDTIYGGRGVDNINAGPGNDTVYADWGDPDIVHGDAGDDNLYAEYWSNLYGDAGNDDYIIGHDGAGPGILYDAGPSSDTLSKDRILLAHTSKSFSDYWIYVGDADGDGPDDLIISIIDVGFVTAVIDWNTTPLPNNDIHQLDSIQVGISGSCLKINRTQFLNYMNAIIDLVDLANDGLLNANANGAPPTTQQMSTLSSYWATTACGI